jgi:hypothetical protein
VSDCQGLTPDGVVQDACGAAFNCPQNEPGSPLFIRMRQYQRGLDPVSGVPVTDWQYVGTECIPETLGGLVEQAEPDSGPGLFELVVAEWQRVRIPAARLGVNPVDGRTLVNFDTVFFTDGAERSFPVSVLGRSVVIYAVPVEFTWHFGDGATSTTTSAGAPYPSTEITHTYEQTGEVSARVDVRYRAEFTVDGGQRLSIPGVAEVTGVSEELVILEARTRLVDG